MDEPLMQPDEELPAPDRHSSELSRLERQSQEHLDGWKRAKADYLNLKKQSEKEKQEIAQFAQAASVMQFLPMYDNLKRAAAHIPPEVQEQEWAKGIELIRRQFEDQLKSMGLEPIKTVGSTFDPNLHHAVSKVKEDSAAPGTIVAEVKTGWKWADRVLEPAQVTVAE